MLTKLYVKSVLALRAFGKDERGVTAVEYAIMAVAISAVVLAVFKNGKLEGVLNTAMSAITEQITKAKS
ncbi:Flp family type IVb pilin [Vibrio cincinnatiensis]|uniref:Flp family type IVb pilin n=1 Tax=Vibrio cincinnatiensis TaxID=675 RepID=UPI001EDD1A1C|nr:Flp family type IVb pilin [Vibrio cincinnatiensis]MCG3759805.1 Flp family type IVb pilin [Vibrio cincinnatiensis]MCG3763022.1 Flp family type IVb pilin [Vibrio cincinnatiensis]